MKKRLLLTFAILFAITACFEGAQGRIMTVHGIIHIKKLDDSFYVVLASNQPAGKKDGGKRDYLIKGPLREELGSNFQGRAVTLEGAHCISPFPEIAECLKPSKIMID